MPDEIEIPGSYVPTSGDDATSAKAAFLATISHEVRTPLNAVIGMAEVLASTPLDTGQRESLQVLERNALRLLDLFNNILSVAGLESGRIELDFQLLDLREVVRQAVEAVAPQTVDKRLFLTKAIDPGIPLHLVGDPTQLRLILVHLLGNAIKFTNRGGVALKVAVEGTALPAECLLRFTIADTGIGIPSEKLGLIFESFTKADCSSTRTYEGAGLGLTIASKLVDRMGGAMTVESSVDVGSTFSFTAKFEIQEPQTNPKATALSPIEDLESKVSAQRILLADDTEDSRRLVLLYLKRANPAIDVAENGAVALDLFRSRRYDLVLMDVEMEIMDGYTATREIRRLETETSAKPTPILALTAHSFSEVAAKGFDAGFTELLTKPIRKIELLQALARYAPENREQSSLPETHTNEVFTTAGAVSDADLFVPPRPPYRFRVPVEEGMEDVVPAYIDKKRAEVPLYIQSVDSRDFDRIRTFSHKMKGTGAGYGLPVLTRLAEIIEKAALRENAADIRSAVDELAHYLNNIELEYSK